VRLIREPGVGAGLRESPGTQKADEPDRDQVDRDDEVQKLGHHQNQDAREQRDERRKADVDIQLITRCVERRVGSMRLVCGRGKSLPTRMDDSDDESLER